MNALCVQPISALPADARARVLPDPVQQAIREQLPDTTLLALCGEAVLARCSLWWTRTACLDGQPTGNIGHYDAQDDVAAAQLIAHACELLGDNGCRYAVGPLDGTTWRRYRFVVDPGTEAPFFLEPTNPAAWVRQFEAAGFKECASYMSSVVTDLSKEDARVRGAGERLQAQGIRIRPLTLSAYTSELEHLYSLACDSFADNVLYSPIDRGEFIVMYERLRSFVDPRFVQMAFDGAALVGFLFAVPDPTMPGTLILKTVASRKGRRYAGLGNVLVAMCHRSARDVGFTRVIHALMHAENNSLNLSARYGSPMRRYALFSKRLNVPEGVDR